MSAIDILNEERVVGETGRQQAIGFLNHYNQVRNYSAIGWSDKL